MSGDLERRESIYVGGSWIPSTGTEFSEVIDSATEDVIGIIPEGTSTDVDRAVEAAAKAFPAWSETEVKQRCAILQSIEEGLTARSSELTKFITQEVGMPYQFAETWQTGLAIAGVAATRSALQSFEWEEVIGNALVVREPAGVVGAITPWNYPLHQVCLKVAAALAAGCTVVLKPSEVAPLTAFVLADIIHDIGLPQGVFNLVPGTGAIVGEAIVSHPLVDMISFTGSTRAGKRIMELAASRVKRVALELGGKSANLILTDADLQIAVARGVDDCFRNAGQNCTAQTRMLVPRSSLKSVEEIAIATAENYVAGDPFEKETTLGPLASAIQRDRVRNYIRLGIEEGASLLTGGAEAPAGLIRGYFVKPTVFSNVTMDMTIAREEIFGPVLCIIPYDTEEEGVAIANDSDYGLAGGVWSSDQSRAEQFARRIRAGRVLVNGGKFNWDAPFGGYKQSGLGREGGRYGIEEFLEVKSMLR